MKRLSELGVVIARQRADCGIVAAFPDGENTGTTAPPPSPPPRIGKGVTAVSVHCQMWVKGAMPILSFVGTIEQALATQSIAARWALSGWCVGAEKGATPSFAALRLHMNIPPTLGNIFPSTL